MMIYTKQKGLWREGSENIFTAVQGNMSNKEVISCKVQDCIRELTLVMSYVKDNH